MRPLVLAALTFSLLIERGPSALAQPLAEPSAQTLAGSWYAEARSENLVGILFEFTPDGKFSYSLGAIYEYKYRFEGGKLVLNFLHPQRGAQPDEVSAASVARGKLVMANMAQQTVLYYTRSGQPEAGANP